MKIILIANYKKDKQESMLRFAQMLYTGFSKKGFSVEIWYPYVIIAYFFKNTNRGLGKWAAYIDKWIISLIILRIKSLLLWLKQENIRYHICDHSNSIYLMSLPNRYASITCHDVLAIRAGFGLDGTYCSASITGRVLQRMILKKLISAKSLAAVSKFTLDQLKELCTLTGRRVNRNWTVIYNSFNAKFEILEDERRTKLLCEIGISEEEPFILHVGSDLPRKNRKMLIDMLVCLGNQWRGNVCFVGFPLDSDIKEYAKNAKLENRIISVVKPNHDMLNALYCSCYAFVFPSFSEGFGWPLIEAQACGVPVITSNLEPMIEVSGGAALYADPNSPESFSHSLLSLNNENVKKNLIDQGLLNIHRFDEDSIINAYLQLMKII